MKKLLLFLSIIALLSLGACSLFDKESEETETAGITDNEILIGSSAALGGHASFLGTQTIHGSMAYIKEVNESGGVNGRQIRLISYDDQYDPPKTVANTQKLISQDGVFALFDYVGTPTSVKIIDMVHEAKIPLLGLFTGAEDLRTPFRPYIFNVRDSYYSEAEGAIDHFVNKLGKKKIAVLYQEDAFGKAVLSGIQISLDKRGLKPVATDTYVRGTMNVEDALTNIKKSNADVVMMVGTYTPLAKFIELSHQSKFKPYFHTVSFIGSEAYGTEIIKREGIDK
ncbi:ABC transporter substrate-binding protein, partial [Patescibacteria group bacterium]|nr:ABC transporter substrate-binding protein [Patescibacteria group bacterium]